MKILFFIAGTAIGVLWVGVYVFVVAFLALGGDDDFLTGKFPNLDYELKEYRKAVPVDRRWFYLAVFVLLGLLWPIMLAVLCVIIGARKAIVLLRK